ncbi:MAG: glutamine synthetase, partial [Spirochaetia bacterium]|nr:glutamine synthetase [Spirochaetia bacterium]
MTNTHSEVMSFIKEQDVRFVRLVFCDIFGQIKNISISADELGRAFTTGISFDASAVKGFLQVDESDLLLFPDASTLSILPWRPAQGRVVRFFCSIKRPDGTPFEGDGRSLLAETVQKATLQGYQFGVGPECEFYLFKLDENGLPTFQPMDRGSYLDVAPLDKGENVRREICLTLEQMGFYTERSHHESGPGQHEIDFKYGSPLEAADNFITFKSVVKTIADRSGLFASFMPKPLAQESGSGLHINLSITQEGKQDRVLEQQMTAGILNRINEISLFLNPLVNSYERLGCFEAPRYIGWGRANRSLLIRLPQTSAEYRRIEVR